jgi:hypothetical protein
MNLNSLFNMANVSPPKNSYTVRQERIKREGSSYYTWQVPATAVAATATIYVPDQFPTSNKYAPLDWLEIVNNEGANDLTLNINGDTFAVPAGTIRKIENKALHTVSVTNNGGAITTLNKITVTMRKAPLTIDQWARSQK